MQTLFTIGYEQAKPDAVLGELKRAKVDLLVDTRAVAASRRPGFSKRQLAASLDEAGIACIHLQKLGTPAQGRQAAPSATSTRSGASTTSTSGRRRRRPRSANCWRWSNRASASVFCLLCYERDPNECHRSRIAALVKKRTRVKVDDLIPQLF
jgi:uncharacterized protein (DUF488 family)